jgi:hypothetical protein
LAVLADAIVSEDAKRGLALLVGDIPPDANALSQSLRRAAMNLDAVPEEATLRQALAKLTPSAAAVQKP